MVGYKLLTECLERQKFSSARTLVGAVRYRDAIWAVSNKVYFAEVSLKEVLYLTNSICSNYFTNRSSAKYVKVEIQHTIEVLVKISLQN